MKTKALLIVLSLALTLGFIACESDPEENVIVLTGAVFYYNESNNVVPVESALVTAEELFLQTLTDGNGIYTFEFESDKDTVNVNINASKEGFVGGASFISAKKGQSLQVPAIQLTIVSDDTSDSGSEPSGDASHVEVVPGHDSQVYVYSSGLQETALIGFKVTDSEGVLVDSDHAVNVQFEIVNGPGGGEYLYPESMVTDDGYVYTVLNSGTIAGPVQISASFTNVNGTQYSLPTRLAIFGGLPDDEHFSVAIDKVNIAGQVHFGILDQVTAFVGDKFSNPVAPGIVVYFSSDYGIVEGAAVTDELGRASVNFMSAAPLPPNPAVSSLANVTAWTYGDTITNVTLSSNVNLLLSSVTDAIEINPTSFEYDETNTPKAFTFNVSDIYENPIVSNSTIVIKATDGELYGDTDIRMMDTRYPGPGSTDFSFSWAPGDSLEAPQVYITIVVSTPSDGNGYQSTSISGVKTGN